MILNCNYCNKQFRVKENNIGQRKRSIRLGLPIYCSRKCAWIGRRTNETEEEKKTYKKWYDLFIRVSMTDDERDLDTLQNMVYFQLDYAQNPDKYREERQRRMPSHIEYCRQPEYRKYKKEYDEKHRAQKLFGAFWECAIILKNLDNEIDYRESKRQNKIYNKSTTKRKRSWQKQLKQNLKNLQLPT
jgi:hypothetical protein